jgi:lipoprotein-anchoring transpeptidase ErfK/SrfK
MGDYSNLFRGGGVSNVTRGRRNRGNKKYIIIILAVLIGLLLWYWFGTKKKVNPIVKKNNNNQVLTTLDDETKTNKTSSENNKTSGKVELSNSDLSETETEIDIPKVTLSPEKYEKVKKNLEKAIKAFKDEEFVDAKSSALEVVNSGLEEGDKIWEKAADILSKANIAIYMSDMPSPQKKLYTIQAGDSLIKIAKLFHTTVEAIQKSNGLNPANPIIFPGKTLYIYQGNWSIKVSKNKFRLYLYNGDELFKIYNVGVGRQGRTPEGTFIIKGKQKNPIWYNEGKAIPFGSKENVLGTRWMALKPTGDTNQHLSGYGIHGTWLPETIGTKSSNGCIRMKNNDVNELFSIVPRKTKVLIQK